MALTLQGQKTLLMRGKEDLGKLVDIKMSGPKLLSASRVPNASA